MDKKSGKSGGQDTADQAGAGTEQLPNPGRRRFSRGAVAGGAVLLSLGNRAAWGQPMGCMSVATVNSFDPTTGMFISAPAGIRPDHNEDLAAEIYRVGNPGGTKGTDRSIFLGTDGTYSVCEDPRSLDSVCLVKGKCP